MSILSNVRGIVSSSLNVIPRYPICSGVVVAAVTYVGGRIFSNKRDEFINYVLPALSGLTCTVLSHSVKSDGLGATVSTLMISGIIGGIFAHNILIDSDIRNSSRLEMVVATTLSTLALMTICTLGKILAQATNKGFIGGAVFGSCYGVYIWSEDCEESEIILISAVAGSILCGTAFWMLKGSK